MVIVLFGACVWLSLSIAKDGTDATPAVTPESMGPYLADMRELSVDPRNPDTVQAFGASVVKSLDGGRTWRFLRRGIRDDLSAKIRKETDRAPSVVGLVRASLANHEFPSVLYVGTELGGKAHGDLYRSGDGGETWATVALMPEDEALDRGLQIHAIAAAPGNPSRVFVGTTSGLFLGTEDGREIRFEPKAELVERNVYDLAVVPDAQRVTAATDNGVHVSNDMGRSWSVSFDGFARRSIEKIAIPPEDGGGLLGLAQGTLYIRRGGRNWEILNRDAHNFTVGGKDGATVFAQVHGFRIDRSADGGATWQRCAEFEKDFNIADTTFANGRLYVLGRRGSIRVSEDEGNTWAGISAALGRPYGAWKIGVDPHNPSRVYTGVRPGGGHTVLKSRPPPSGEKIAIPLKLCRTLDGGATWLDLPPKAAETDIDFEGGYATLVTGSGMPGKVLYAATFLGYPVALASVARSLDGGKSWEAFDNQSGMGRIESLAVDPQSDRVVYAGNNRGRLYVSRDAAETWTLLGESPDAGRVNDILIRPNGENAIYIATDLGVFRIGL